MLLNLPGRTRRVSLSCVVAKWLIVLVALSGAGVIHAVTVPASWAYAEKDPYSNFKSGDVTDIQEKAIQIDRIRYPLVESVIVMDQYERLVSVKDLVPGERVLFHLDSNGRIDRIVLLIPS
jgi:hypothetical protein